MKRNGETNPQNVLWNTKSPTFDVFVAYTVLVSKSSVKNKAKVSADGKGQSTDRLLKYGQKRLRVTLEMHVCEFSCSTECAQPETFTRMAALVVNSPVCQNGDLRTKCYSSFYNCGILSRCLTLFTTQCASGASHTQRNMIAC